MMSELKHPFGYNHPGTADADGMAFHCDLDPARSPQSMTLFDEDRCSVGHDLARNQERREWTGRASRRWIFPDADCGVEEARVGDIVETQRINRVDIAALRRRNRKFIAQRCGVRLRTVHCLAITDRHQEVRRASVDYLRREVVANVSEFQTERVRDRSRLGDRGAETWRGLFHDYCRWPAVVADDFDRQHALPQLLPEVPAPLESWRCPPLASHHHAPSALWPAPTTSAPAGVNDRSRQVAPEMVGDSRKVVSDWLNSRAMSFRSASSR